MALSQGARHSIAYGVQGSFGTAATSMSELLITGTTLGTDKDTFRSETLRSDRQIIDLRHGISKVGGDVNFELRYGVFDDFLEGALQGTWSTNVLKAGTTAKYFTIERAFNDVTQYRQFTGCAVNEMTLDIKPDGMVTGKFSILGKSETVASSPIDGTITAATANAPFDGFTGSLSEGGSAANVTAISLSVNNNLAPQFIVGDTSAATMLSGLSDVTGSITAWFESATLLNKFLNETESSISVTLESAAGNLVILVPRIKYTGASADVTNANDGVFLTMPFQALRDDTEATNLKITRVPA